MIVWLASYPRSGNTFLRVILKSCFDLGSYSQYNDQQDIAKDHNTAKAVGHLNYEGSWEDFYQRAKASDDLYLIKTHHRPKDDSPAIYVAREPRAALVSFHNYMTNFSNLDLTAAETILGASAFGSWGEHYDAWKPKSRKNTLLLQFEDLTKNPLAAAEQMGEFLDLGKARKKMPSFEELQEINPRFFRTGSNEKNIRTLSDDEDNLVRFLYQSQMRALGYKVEPSPKKRPALELIEDTSHHLWSLQVLIRKKDEEARKKLEQQESRLKIELDAAHDKIKALQQQRSEWEHKVKYLHEKIDTDRAKQEEASRKRLEEEIVAKKELLGRLEQERRQSFQQQGKVEELLRQKSEIEVRIDTVREKAESFSLLQKETLKLLEQERLATQAEKSISDKHVQRLDQFTSELAQQKAYAEDILKEKARNEVEAAALRAKVSALEEIRIELTNMKSVTHELKEALHGDRDSLVRMQDFVSSLTTQKIDRERYINKIEAELSRANERTERIAQRNRELQAQYQSATDRLVEVNHALEPRFKSLLTLRPARYIMRQRTLMKKGLLTLNEAGVPTVDLPPAPPEEKRTIIEPRMEPKVLKGTGHRASIYANYKPTKPLGIAVYTFDRADSVEHVLESLMLQDALEHTHVFIDGDQGNASKRARIDETERIVSEFPVKKVHRNRGNYGFRKMMVVSMRTMMEQYERILFLEDDCFPTRYAYKGFSMELDKAENDPDIMSVYGHPFFMPVEEAGPHGRFQGWGWATTREKLRLLWQQLLELYLLNEEEYLRYMEENLTPELREKLDVTPGRQPTSTLPRFFAWDEVLGFLAAKAGVKHARTQERLIYNFGVGGDSTHFNNIEHYRKPPFNMVTMEELWQHF